MKNADLTELKKLIESAEAWPEEDMRPFTWAEKEYYEALYGPGAILLGPYLITKICDYHSYH